MLFDYSLAVTVTDFVGVLEQEGVSHPHIVAHSYSGRFAELYYFLYKNDPVLSPKSLILLATSFSGSLAGVGLKAINMAISHGDLCAIATGFQDFAVTVSCNSNNPDACSVVPYPATLADLEEEVFLGATQTSVYAYQSYTTVAQQASSNFVPGFVNPINIPTLPFTGPTSSNPIGVFTDITIPVAIFYGTNDEINVPQNLNILGACFTNSSALFEQELRGVPHFSMLTNYAVLAKKFTEFIYNIDERCTFLFFPPAACTPPNPCI